MAKLTAEERKKLSDSDFALPGRRYPIHDEAHARDALARGAHDATADEYSEIKRKVKAKFPGIDVDGDTDKTMSLVYYLNSPPESKFVGADVPELPKTRNGLTCFHYWKDVLEPGHYEKQPDGSFPGWDLDVSDGDIDEFVHTFSAMDKNGVESPIVKDHRDSRYRDGKFHSQEPIELSDNTLGYIVGMKKGPDGRLYALHQFLGEAARDVGLKNKVSVGIANNFIDGKGVRYGKAIAHSASTPIPVVPNQGEFFKAASRVGAVGFNLSRSQNMADNMIPCSNACMSRMEKSVGGLAKKPIEEKGEHIASHLEGVRSGLKRLSNMSEDGDSDQMMSLIQQKLDAKPGVLTATTSKNARQHLQIDAGVKDEELPETIAVKAMSLAASSSTKDAEIAKLKKDIEGKDGTILTMSNALPGDIPAPLMKQQVHAWRRQCDNAVGEGKFTEPEIQSLESILGIGGGQMKGMSLAGVPGDDQLCYAVLKWAMSLSGNGVKLNAGTERDTTATRLVEQQQNADGPMTQERWNALGMQGQMPAHVAAAR